jgi:hypothetical protein
VSHGDERVIPFRKEQPRFKSGNHGGGIRVAGLIPVMQGVVLVNCPPASNISVIPAKAGIQYHPNMAGGFVYIVASKRNGTLYVGVTSNLSKRVYEHKTEAAKGFTA